MLKANIGKRIRKQRIDSGLTQAELAAKLGVSRATISSWETDRTEPAMQDVQALAAAMGCQPSDLVGNFAEEVRADDTIRRLSAYLSALTQVQREELVKQAEYYAWKNSH